MQCPDGEDDTRLPLPGRAVLSYRETRMGGNDMHQAPSQSPASNGRSEPGHRGKVTRWETVPVGNGYTALQRVVARPGANSAVLHHKILGGGAVVRTVERVLETRDPGDPRRLRREVIQVENVLLRLAPATCPLCTQVPCKHLHSAATAVAFLQDRRSDRTPGSPLVGLDHESREPVTVPYSVTTAGVRVRCLGRIVDHEPDLGEEDAPRPAESEYDGPGLLADWGHTVRGAHPNASHVQLIGAAIPVGQAALNDHWAVDAEALPTTLSIQDVAGPDDGTVAMLSPIVDRAIGRTISYVPRLFGDREDLFQYGMEIAIPEARRLSRIPGETDQQFASRLEHRVALAVRHRLIDAIRRQDAADRNTPSSSLEEARERGAEPGEDGDPFDLVFRPYQDGRRDARVRAIALHVHRQAQGLARLIVARAYIAAFGCSEKRRKGIAELRDHPDYSAAAKRLASLWGEAMTRFARGEIAPVYDRVRSARRVSATSAA